MINSLKRLLKVFCEIPFDLTKFSNFLSISKEKNIFLFNYLFDTFFLRETMRMPFGKGFFHLFWGFFHDFFCCRDFLFFHIIFTANHIRNESVKEEKYITQVLSYKEKQVFIRRVFHLEGVPYRINHAATFQVGFDPPSAEKVHGKELNLQKKFVISILVIY